ERLERAHEDRARLPFTARDGVEAPVHAINEIDVGNARSTVERIRPSGTASSGVARQIVLAEVRLRFDDAAAGDTITRPTLEYRTEQVTGDELCSASVELTWKHRRLSVRPRSRREGGQLSVFGVLFFARARRCAVFAAVRARVFRGVGATGAGAVSVGASTGGATAAACRSPEGGGFARP